MDSDVINGNPLSDVINGNQACSRGVKLTWSRGVKLWPLRERRTATAPARRGGVGQTTVARPRWRAATMASPIMQRVSPDEGGNPRQSEALRGAHENITSASSSVIKRHQASSGVIRRHQAEGLTQASKRFKTEYNDGDELCPGCGPPRRLQLHERWVWIVPDEGGHQRSSVPISSHQRSSAVIRGHQWSSAVVSGHQQHFEVIRVLIEGHLPRISVRPGSELDAVE